MNAFTFAVWQMVFCLRKRQFFWVPWRKPGGGGGGGGGMPVEVRGVSKTASGLWVHVFIQETIFTINWRLQYLGILIILEKQWLSY